MLAVNVSANYRYVPVCHMHHIVHLCRKYYINFTHHVFELTFTSGGGGVCGEFKSYKAAKWIAPHDLSLRLSICKHGTTGCYKRRPGDISSQGCGDQNWMFFSWEISPFPAVCGNKTRFLEALGHFPPYLWKPNEVF